jgi:hypothetical protein
MFDDGKKGAKAWGRLTAGQTPDCFVGESSALVQMK